MNATAQTELPLTVSAFGVVLDETQDPPRISLIHNDEDRDEDGKIRKPKGWGLPGGGQIPFKRLKQIVNGEEAEVTTGDKTPRHAARREVKDEAGIKTKLGKFFKNSRYGEALVEKKSNTNHEVYTFFLRALSNGNKILEVNESGASGDFTLADILQMPLAVDKKSRKNAYGIYFKHRERTFLTLHKAGYDFRRLIPNLRELMRRIDHEEVGVEVYHILRGALTPEELAALTATANMREENGRSQASAIQLSVAAPAPIPADDGRRSVSEEDDETRRWREFGEKMEQERKPAGKA